MDLNSGPSRSEQFLLYHQPPIIFWLSFRLEFYFIAPANIKLVFDYFGIASLKQICSPYYLDAVMWLNLMSLCSALFILLLLDINRQYVWGKVWGFFCIKLIFALSVLELLTWVSGPSASARLDIGRGSGFGFCTRICERTACCFVYQGKCVSLQTKSGNKRMSFWGEGTFWGLGYQEVSAWGAVALLLARCWNMVTSVNLSKSRAVR